MSGSWRNGDCFIHLCYKIRFKIQFSGSVPYEAPFLPESRVVWFCPAFLWSTGIWIINETNPARRKTPDLTLQIGECAGRTVSIAENTGNSSCSPGDSLKKLNLWLSQPSWAAGEPITKSWGSRQRLVKWRSSQHRAGSRCSFQEPVSIKRATHKSAQKVVEQHDVELAPQYGFVLRYPDGKSDVTGVDFENWHYRYVGVRMPIICRSTICSEEYIALLKGSRK